MAYGVESRERMDEATAGLRRALAEGSSAQRREAFERLIERYPGAPDFEGLVLETAWRAPEPELRAAAVLAARFYGSEAALAATLDALKSPAARREATRVLRVSSRPGLSARLLGELEAALIARDAEWSRAVLRALSLRREPEIARLATTLLDSHGEDAAVLVLASDDPDLLRSLADRVHSRDPGTRVRAVEAAFKLGADAAFARLSPLLAGPERPSSERVAQAREILSEARRGGDERWPRLALEIVEARAGLREPSTLRGFPIEHLLSALGEFGYAPALPSLWTILKAGRLETYPLVAAIARIEGPDAFARLLAAAAPWLDAALGELFLEIADGPARAVDVRGLLARLPAGAAARVPLERLLSRLESRYNRGG